MFILLVASVVFAALFFRLAWIQLINGETYRTLAEQSRYVPRPVAPRRGGIYDAQGQPLAISVTTASFFATPREVVDSGQAKEIADQVAAALELDSETLLERITDTKRGFVYIKRQVPDGPAAAVKSLGLKGIHWEEESERVYPKGTLLANSLGFVGLDNTGLGGLESSFNSLLAGQTVAVLAEQDKNGQRSAGVAQRTTTAPVDGVDLILTIDEVIQYICERELGKVTELYSPEKAGILIMEPQTGRVLGMAEYPTFDPNNFGQYDEQNRRNFLISDVYEPGSTFKTVVMAGALEEGVTSLNQEYGCDGPVRFPGGMMVRCWRAVPHGRQTFMEGIQNSCNPVFIAVGQEMGKELFYKYLHGFGFGQKTGIDLAGEADGLVLPQNKCQDLDLATMSIGQTTAVTPIQLLTAFGAICNGGRLMKPQVIKEIWDAQGNLLETVEPEMTRQVISQTTSDLVLRALETVVSQGIGKTAFVEGYRVGGKTGTAQKVVPGVGYSEQEFVASFMGVAPVNDPQIVCLIVVDYPKGDTHGGSAICGPVFQAVAKDVMSYLEIPAQVAPALVKATSLEEVTLLDYVGLTTAAANSQAAAQGIEITLVGDGEEIYAQLPLAGDQMLRGGTVVLHTRLPKVPAAPQIAVPELTGKTAAEVAKIAAAYDLHFDLAGQGVVMYQQPSPGSMADAGSRVFVGLEKPLEAGVLEDLAGP
jgi:stage V sporulation protein D (sporulation-specific penicillin-binding protein)